MSKKRYKKQFPKIQPQQIATKKVEAEELTEDEKKRRDWEINDTLICTAFCDLLLANQKLPSVQAVAEKCQLSHKTVDRHLKDANFDTFKQKFRAGNEKVMLNLFRQAATSDNVSMIKLWFEITEGLGTKKQVDITSNGKQIGANLADIPTDKLLEYLDGR
jgi:heat shock protein HspQ